MQLRERINEIKKYDYQIVVIAPSKATFINQFIEHFGPFPFSIYGDPSRKAYKGMGHVTMSKWKLILKAVIGFISGKVKNFFPEDSKQKEFVKKSMKTQDVFIQGGTWLFAPEGKILWQHIDASPEDHASIDEILVQIRKVPSSVTRHKNELPFSE